MTTVAPLAQASVAAPKTMPRRQLEHCTRGATSSTGSSPNARTQAPATLQRAGETLSFCSRGCRTQYEEEQNAARDERIDQ